MSGESAFGKYHLIAELGHGGMADVFLAVVGGPSGLGFSKLLVVKRLRPNLVEDPDFVSMLIDEARIAARLNHSNVVQTIEVGQVGNDYFIAMEYLEGQPLHRIQLRASKKGHMRPELQYRVIADVLAGLHHAHELLDYNGTPLDVVHRDVSPHNVFVTYEGVTKVVDFGIAKAVGRSVETRTGVVKGKITYMAPEQAMGSSVDRRADIYSVGVMLWEAATGQRFWKGQQEFTVLQSLMSGSYDPSPRAVAPDIPEEIDRMCRRAMAVRADDRFATAADFQTELEGFLKDARHVTHREVGSAVSELFADKRHEIRQIIDTRLAELGEGVSSSVQPLRLNTEPHSTSVPSLQSSSSSAKTDASRSGLAATLPSPTLPSPGSASGGPDAAPARFSIGPPGEPTAATVLGVTTASAVRSAAAPRGKLGRIGILAAGGLAVAGLTWVLALRFASPPLADTDPKPPAAPQKATQESEAAERPVKPETAQKVTLTLRAKPVEARFSVDDGPWLDNPHILRVSKDAGKHRVVVEAPGHVSTSREVTFSEDAVVDVVLEKETVEKEAVKPSAVVPRRAAAPIKTVTAATSTPAPKPTTAPKRSIDTDNPWD